MRRRLLLAVLATTVVATPAAATRVGRVRVNAGDTCVARILAPGEFDEFLVEAPRGARIGVRLGTASPGSCNPVAGVLDADYVPLPVAGTSARNIFTSTGLPRSDTYRVLVTGQNGSVGGYRVTTSVKPALRFSLRGRARKSDSETEAQRTLVFGAYPGFTFRVGFTSKGGAPATLAAVTGPDGADLEPVAAKRKRGKASVVTYTATQFGDHRVALDVPADAKSWSISVSLSGRLAHGTDHDLRETDARPAPVRLVPSATVPLVQVVDEHGGPNSFGLSAFGGRPVAVFADSRTGTCIRATTESSSTPSTYELRCVNGYLALIEDALPEQDGVLLGFTAPVLRDPIGSGSATVDGLAYDDLGWPTGWTETRHYAASGTDHTLVFHDIERYGNADRNLVRPDFERNSGYLAIDQAIEPGTTFTEFFEPPSNDFGASGVQVGDALRLVRETAQLSGKQGAIVARNVRDIRIVGVTQTTLTLAEPLVAETPPPGTRFQYVIARRSTFIRSYSVEHTDEAGRTTSLHDAGGRIR